MKKDKKQYEAPSLTVVSFQTERGYAGSAPLGLSEFMFWDNDKSEDQMEDYSVANDWNQGTNSFWD